MAVLGASSWVADTIADGYAAPLAGTDTDNYSTADHVYESVGDTNASGAPIYVNIASTSDVWAGAKHHTNSTANSLNSALAGTNMAFIDGSGNVVASITSTASEDFKLFVRVGGTLTQVAATATAQSFSAVPARFDAHLNVNASGSFDFYVNGTLALTYSGDITDGGAYTAIESVQFFGLWSVGTAQNRSFWWCLVCDDDSRAYHCEQIIGDGAGAHGDFTGAYTAVDDVRTATPYVDLISSDTVGHRFSQTVVNPLATYATGYDVIGVQVTNRARAGNGNPRIKPLIRHGGVDAVGNAVLLNGTDSAAKHLFTVNPSTGLPWTYADLASIEIGCEVAAAV